MEGAEIAYSLKVFVLLCAVLLARDGTAMHANGFLFFPPKLFAEQKKREICEQKKGERA